MEPKIKIINTMYPTQKQNKTVLDQKITSKKKTNSRL